MTAFKVRSPQPAGAGGERVARRSLVAGVAVEVLRLSSPFAKGAQDKSDSLRDDSVLRSGGGGQSRCGDTTAWRETAGPSLGSR